MISSNTNIDTVAHLLIVDDDKRLRILLKRHLLNAGFMVSSASDIHQAYKALCFFIFDVLIVDIMMPGGSGKELLKKDFQHKIPPILFLSAMGDIEDRIEGLTLGAADYLVKPFEPRELILRLQKIIKSSSSKSQNILLGRFLYNLKEQTLLGYPLLLTEIEGKLLHFMTLNINCTVSREDIMKNVFSNATNIRVVDVQINRLRRKIELHPQEPQYLVSIRGKGYCLKINGT